MTKQLLLVKYLRPVGGQYCVSRPGDRILLDACPGAKEPRVQVMTMTCMGVTKGKVCGEKVCGPRVMTLCPGTSQ